MVPIVRQILYHNTKTYSRNYSTSLICSISENKFANQRINKKGTHIIYEIRYTVVLPPFPKFIPKNVVKSRNSGNTTIQNEKKHENK